MDLRVTGLQGTEPVGQYTKANKSKFKKSLDIVKQQQMLKTFHTNTASRNKTVIDWPLLNRSSKIAPITINFKLIIITSRILGCHPHPLWSSDKMVNTGKFAKLYSIIWAIVITIFIAIQIWYLSLCPFKTDDDSLCIPRIIFIIAILVVHLLCVLFSVVRAGNFETAIARIQDFDEATCSEQKYYVLTNIVAAVLLIISWCTVIWIADLKLIFIEPSTIMFILGSWVFSLEIYRFFFIFIAVLGRFVRLKTLISSGGIDVGVTKGIYYQPLTVQNVFILHYWLSDAAENFNKYFSIQIVYWLIYTIANLINGAFHIALSLVLETFTSAHIATLVFLIYKVTLICGASHFTCKRANELGKLLFAYRAPKLETTVSSMEVLEFGFYLYTKPLKVTGSGMFFVDFPLLLAVLEAAFTYMTLIIQNGASYFEAVAVNHASWNPSGKNKTET